jgi:ArsR family transcriptional regulator
MMGDPFRLKALMLVAERGPVSVTQICNKLKTKQPTASYHLGLLKLANLVSTKRHGKQILYRLSDRFSDGVAWGALLRLHDAGAKRKK